MHAGNQIDGNDAVSQHLTRRVRSCRLTGMFLCTVLALGVLLSGAAQVTTVNMRDTTRRPSTTFGSAPPTPSAAASPPLMSRRCCIVPISSWSRRLRQAVHGRPTDIGACSRTSPCPGIAAARSGGSGREERTREEVRDFSAAGKNGFISSTYGMCVTALEYGDDQFFELAVTLLGAGHGTSSAACHCAMKLSSQVAEKV